jgi:hypothetical protein
MINSTIDHIVIVSPTLEAGAHWVHEALGVLPQPGGVHERMGTHNLLLRLGDSCYLEVISPKPDAAKPSRPRWFMLDETTTLTAPRLATWVLRVGDIHAASERCGPSVGTVEPMTRGQLSWQITIPPDGSLSMDGAMPTLIQWANGCEPTHTLAASGCTLTQLDVLHPDAGRIENALSDIGFAGNVRFERPPQGSGPSLRAHIMTPAGLRVIPPGHVAG